jgi:hypothetical protein
MNMTSYAWHFIQRTIRSASGFVNAYVLSPFDRDTLETIILNRHRRSGMPLWFLEPPSQVPSFFANRFRKKDEDRQKALRTAFFDRLYRVSDQTLLLALFYWIRSVEFQADENRLEVHPLEPIDFSFLATFDMNRAFTLDALLIHGTLTLEEHNRIFRMTDAESTFLLESLLNLRLILPYRPGADRAGIDLRVLPEVRYRLHPFIIHPVTELLRQRHIVY